MLQREEMVRERFDERPNQQQQQQMQAQMAGGVACPKCGTVNEPEAMFCASCGTPLRKGSCPNCGSEIDMDADFCETCHHYIRRDVCSFCGASISESDTFCPECGSPRGGIVCPTCHTLNDFSFCKQCGTPLTEQAKQLVMQLRLDPDYRQMVVLAKEFDQLEMEVPQASHRDEVRNERSEQLRERVLKLLAQDKGLPEPKFNPEPENAHISKEELDRKKRQVLDRLTQLLDNMAIPQMPSPATVRNYAMAQKPAGVRLAWVCNYKHALHSSPCGCAKPQLGGKWIVLGHNSKDVIKDDI